MLLLLYKKFAKNTKEACIHLWRFHRFR